MVFREADPVIEKYSKKITAAKPKADAIVTGRIQQNEMPGNEHLLYLTAMLVSTRSGEVLWTISWQGAVKIFKPEWVSKKTALLICLALAAGILVIYARH